MVNEGASGSVEIIVRVMNTRENSTVNTIMEHSPSGAKQQEILARDEELIKPSSSYPDEGDLIRSASKESIYSSTSTTAERITEKNQDGPKDTSCRRFEEGRDTTITSSNDIVYNHDAVLEPEDQCLKRKMTSNTIESPTENVDAILSTSNKKQKINNDHSANGPERSWKSIDSDTSYDSSRIMRSEAQPRPSKSSYLQINEIINDQENHKHTSARMNNYQDSFHYDCSTLNYTKILSENNNRKQYSDATSPESAGDNISIGERKMAETNKVPTNNTFFHDHRGNHHRLTPPSSYPGHCQKPSVREHYLRPSKMSSFSEADHTTNSQYHCYDTEDTITGGTRSYNMNPHFFQPATSQSYFTHHPPYSADGDVRESNTSRLHYDKRRDSSSVHHHKHNSDIHGNDYSTRTISLERKGGHGNRDILPPQCQNQEDEHHHPQINSLEYKNNYYNNMTFQQEHSTNQHYNRYDSKDNYYYHNHGYDHDHGTTHVNPKQLLPAATEYEGHPQNHHPTYHHHHHGTNTYLDQDGRFNHTTYPSSLISTTESNKNTCYSSAGSAPVPYHYSGYNYENSANSYHCESEVMDKVHPTNRGAKNLNYPMNYYDDERRQHKNYDGNGGYYHPSAEMNFLPETTNVIMKREDSNTAAYYHTTESSPNVNSNHLPPYYCREILALSTSDDENWLSEFLCFVRSQCVEVFTATRDDVASRMNSKKVLLGQVGIRCRFCAHLPHRERTGRSSSYPSSISRIYQSLTMMLRDHFTKCTAMPPPLQEKYLSLKSNASQGATDSKRYWVDSAHTLGLRDTENSGIRFGSSPTSSPSYHTTTTKNNNCASV